MDSQTIAYSVLYTSFKASEYSLLQIGDHLADSIYSFLHDKKTVDAAKAANKKHIGVEIIEELQPFIDDLRDKKITDKDFKMVISQFHYTGQDEKLATAVTYAATQGMEYHALNVIGPAAAATRYFAQDSDFKPEDAFTRADLDQYLEENRKVINEARGRIAKENPQYTMHHKLLDIHDKLISRAAEFIQKNYPDPTQKISRDEFYNNLSEQTLIERVIGDELLAERAVALSKGEGIVIAFGELHGSFRNETKSPDLDGWIKKKTGVEPSKILLLESVGQLDRRKDFGFTESASTMIFTDIDAQQKGNQIEVDATKSPVLPIGSEVQRLVLPSQIAPIQSGDSRISVRN